ncbi:hypothetical protein Bhyg_06827, partial [Pseudolycoriella hygida]
MSLLGELKWAPFRPMDDFLTSSARFKDVSVNANATDTLVPRNFNSSPGRILVAISIALFGARQFL